MAKQPFDHHDRVESKVTIKCRYNVPCPGAITQTAGHVAGRTQEKILFVHSTWERGTPIP